MRAYFNTNKHKRYKDIQRAHGYMSVAVAQKKKNNKKRVKRADLWTIVHGWRTVPLKQCCKLSLWFTYYIYGTIVFARYARIVLNIRVSKGKQYDQKSVIFIFNDGNRCTARQRYEPWKPMITRNSASCSYGTWKVQNTHRERTSHIHGDQQTDFKLLTSPCIVPIWTSNTA